MNIDKRQQIAILQEINGLLEKKGATATAYLFGGNSLISQDIIARATKDIDLFLLIENKEAVPEIKETIQKKFRTIIDIGIDGSFEIEVKGFTWKLPADAYDRANHVMKFSHLTVYALSPLDIVALKCDRLNEQDQKDIERIFIREQPSKEKMTAIFEEYHALLSGNRASIDNIRENFYQLVLTIHDVVLKKE